MKIITWNCNGALRKKFEHLIRLEADIYIVQECEDPALAKDAAYKEWACNYLWAGNNKNKGIGVFASSNIKLTELNLDSGTLQSFLPFMVNDDMFFLAVWTRDANSPTFGYIGQMWKYLQAHNDFIGTQKSVIIGDFNSNKCWDKWDRWWNHSDVVRELEDLNIISLYHYVSNEEQGAESKPTFYLQRNLKKPYHIDYVFASRDLIGDTQNLEIGDTDNWLGISDHMPIKTELI